jgi:hypothetical protein
MERVAVVGVALVAEQGAVVVLAAQEAQRAVAVPHPVRQERRTVDQAAAVQATCLLLLVATAQTA